VENISVRVNKKPLFRAFLRLPFGQSTPANWIDKTLPQLKAPLAGLGHVAVDPEVVAQHRAENFEPGNFPRRQKSAILSIGNSI